MGEPTQWADSKQQPRARRSTAQDRATVADTPSAQVQLSEADETEAPVGSGGRLDEDHRVSMSSGTGGDRGFIDRVRERAGAQLTTQKDRATEGIGTIAQAVRRTTQTLRDDRHDTMAGYVERAADQLEHLSDRLKGRDVGELFRDAQQFARRRPMVFVGSAFVLGLLGARFLKSSAPSAGGGQPAKAGASSGHRPGAPTVPGSNSSVVLSTASSDPLRNRRAMENL
jgi:hypothetical protein